MILSIFYILGYFTCFGLILNITMREQKKLLIEDLFNALTLSLFSWFGILILAYFQMKALVDTSFGKKVIWEEEKGKANVDNIPK